MLVDTFYTNIKKDDLLAPISTDRINDNWPQYLQKMHTFWQTVLLQEHTYFGGPFAPHQTLPINNQHFQAWMQLFIQTVDWLFKGEKAGGGQMARRKDGRPLFNQTRLPESQF